MPPQSVSGHRRALRRLRDVMAGSGTAQERLDQVVRIIAAEMVAEVCSAYIMRAGEVLELFATQGLKQSAVHNTRLRVGEGLVGTVAAYAQPLNLPDAQSHPRFSYRPETGEEIYSSLLGVPILRGGRVRGVLVIQNRAAREYSDEEIETLEVISVIIAELIAAGDLISPIERAPQLGNAILPFRLEGVRINGGLAMGEAVLHQPRISVPRMLAEDTDAEHSRLAEALVSMHSALDDLMSNSRLNARGEHRDVLDTYRKFAEDRGWLRRIREAIDTGLTAEAAVQKVQDDTRVRMNQITDPYIRDRLSDLEDLANRLMQHLSGDARPSAEAGLPDDVILIARSMGPAELLDYDPARLRGLVLEEGAPTSHVAIVARALDIPVVGKVPGLLNRIDPLDPVVVDGDHRQVFIRPAEDILATVTENMLFRAQRRAEFAATRDRPAVTLDGVRITLCINAGLMMDLEYLRETGADGVGLYRTEIPFMVRPSFPDVAAQTDLYRTILDESGGKNVVFRTLDIGGDKELPYFRETGDQNPAMGWRSIRVSLDRPSLLREQVRALIRAANGRELSLMFPMIAEVAEYDAARRIVDLECRRESALGRVLPSNIKIGAMLEVPGLMFQIDALLRRVDFLSVGSNDLIQFMFAVDRGNPRVADRYDVLSPAVVTLLRRLVQKCDSAGVPLSLCGEMAGNPLEAMALIGLGFRSISLPPAKYGAVKEMIRSLSAGSLKAYIETIHDAPDHSLRDKFRAYSRDHGVIVEDI